VEDRGVETGDYLTADVHIKVDGNVVGHTHDGQIVARAGRVGGIQIDDLDTQLAGAKGGETRTISIKAPDTHPHRSPSRQGRADRAGGQGYQTPELAELNEPSWKTWGFGNQQELREALREQMDEKITSDIQQAMREQVNRFLLENTQVVCPNQMSVGQAGPRGSTPGRRPDDARHAARAGGGEHRETASRGAGRSRARAEAVLHPAKDCRRAEVDVSEAELNGRVALLAAQRDQRPESSSRT